MKKYIGLSILSLSVVALFSFIFFGNSELSKANSEFNLDTFMRDKVYTEIGVLTGYNPKKSFSRCPSGFTYVENEKATAAVSYGTIYNAEGCHMEPFCEFKIIVAEKKTFLKKTANEPFIAMADFIKEETDPEADPAKF